jgi:hypothetical protein
LARARRDRAGRTRRGGRTGASPALPCHSYVRSYGRPRRPVPLTPAIPRC